MQSPERSWTSIKANENPEKDNCSRNRVRYGDPLRYISCLASVTGTNIGHIQRGGEGGFCVIPD